MELYYSPMACSFAARVVALEANVSLTLRRVALGSAELAPHNPMRKVPTLLLDDGSVLTECVAVLTYLAPVPRAPHAQLQWLSFVATEVHRRSVTAIFQPNAPPEAVREWARSEVKQPFTVLEARLRDREALLDTFGPADAYLVWALTILPFGGVSLDAYPALMAYRARHAKRPAFAEVLAQERAEFNQGR